MALLGFVLQIASRVVEGLIESRSQKELLLHRIDLAEHIRSHDHCVHIGVVCHFTVQSMEVFVI